MADKIFELPDVPQYLIARYGEPQVKKLFHGMYSIYFAGAYHLTHTVKDPNRPHLEIYAVAFDFGDTCYKIVISDV